MRALHAPGDLEPLFKFPMHLSVRNSPENYRQIYGKSKDSLWRNLAQVRPQIFLGQSFALQLQFTIKIFFRTAVLPKLFDNRFSYKYCNFSHVCLLVKMASKTVTRSISIQILIIWPRAVCFQPVSYLVSLIFCIVDFRNCVICFLT